MILLYSPSRALCLVRVNPGQACGPGAVVWSASGATSQQQHTLWQCGFNPPKGVKNTAGGERFWANPRAIGKKKEPGKGERTNLAAAEIRIGFRACPRFQGQELMILACPCWEFGRGVLRIRGE